MLALVLGALLAIDPTHSKAAFSVQHIFVETVSGTVPVARGAIDLPDGSLVPVHVRAELDATKLRTGDDDRDGALQSPDWFDTKLFPTWSFESEKIVPTPVGFTMTGLLTIHGLTKEEVLNVITGGTPGNPVFRATAKIDRHAFGMKTTRLDPAIGSMVEVGLDIHVK